MCEMAHNGCLSHLKHQLNSVDVNTKFKEWTALQWAVVSCNDRGFDCACHLIENGANLNVRDRFGHTLVHFAALGNSVKMLQLLCILCPTLIDSVDSDSCGDTPLILAATHNNIQALQTLVAMGADVNFVNKMDENAADRAKRFGCHACLEFILIIDM